MSKRKYTNTATQVGRDLAASEILAAPRPEGHRRVSSSSERVAFFIALEEAGGMGRSATLNGMLGAYRRTWKAHTSKGVMPERPSLWKANLGDMRDDGWFQLTLPEVTLALSQR